jgi:uncharacterized damage-inducible protein DinB
MRQPSAVREDATVTISNDEVTSGYLVDLVRTFRNYKALGDGALSQVSDDDLHTLVDRDANSIAVIVKHLAGNLRSRFTDFLTTDGEKPDRDRDAEFEMAERVSRDDINGWWEEGWASALASIESLTPEDLERTVTIRGEPFHVVEALNRLATHAAYHVGQIVLLAKHFAGPNWKSLSIPKGQSKHAKGTYKQGIVPRRPS